MPRKSKKAASTTLEHVHETVESVATIELSPPHPPREETPEYAHAHRLLVIEKNTPCAVCKVRHSDLQDPTRRADPTINRYGATQVESHHYPVERSLIDAVDWRKVHDRFPAVYSQASLVLWVDSPENLLVLCDQCHRSPVRGIHHLLVQDWSIRPFLLDGYEVAARPQDAAAALAHDEQIERAAGIEQAVDAAMTPAPAPAQAAGTDANNVTASSAAPSVAPARPSRARPRRPATSVPTSPTSRRRLPTPAAAPAQGVA